MIELLGQDDEDAPFAALLVSPDRVEGDEIDVPSLHQIISPPAPTPEVHSGSGSGAGTGAVRSHRAFRLAKV